VLGAVLWAAPVHAAQVPSFDDGAPATEPNAPGPETLPTFASPAAQLRGHLLDVSPSAKAVSPWVATDLSALESAASVTGAVSVTETPPGGLVVAARTTAGHVVAFTSSPGGASWATSDLTVLGTAPLAAGSPAVVIDPAGVTRVFFRTASGDLDEIENDRNTADPWFASDLTSKTSPTGGATISSDPVVLAAPGFATSVYARSTTGALVSFTLTSDPEHPWYYVDVSALAEGPTIVGSPAVVPAPDGFGLTAVYALVPNGDLVEFTDDDAGYHLWSVRDVSTSLGLPQLGAPPTALAGLPTEVASVTTTGHLVVVSIPTVSLVSDSFQDVSALAQQKVAPAFGASIAASRAGYVVAAVSAAAHLELFHVASATASAASVEDVSMEPLTEQLAGADPVAVDVGSATQLFVESGGLVGLTARIVLTAESQDQFHAKVEDTPPGSDCNPFTASFDRGTTVGCALGTASEEWCSDFSQWVWQSAGIDTTGITGASKTFVSWGRARRQFLAGINATPAVGDAVVWGVLNPLWGAHVGIVVGVKGKEIDVVSGNSGPFAIASAVWDSGWFLPASQTAQGDPIIGFVSPVPVPGQKAVVRGAPSVWPRTQEWPVVQGQGGATVTLLSP
jgi:CHAP domain